MTVYFKCDKDNIIRGYGFGYLECEGYSTVEVEFEEIDDDLLYLYINNCKLINNQFIELTEEDKQIDISSVPTDKERITKLEEEKFILAENVYQLASIIEAMLGGE